MLFSAHLVIAYLAHCCAIFHLVEQLTIAHHAVLLLPPICHFIQPVHFFSLVHCWLMQWIAFCKLEKMQKHDSTVFIVWQFHLTIAHQELLVTPNYHWLVWPALKRLWLGDTKSSLCGHYHDPQQIHSKISFEWWGIINIIITWWEYNWIITLRITWLFLFSNAPLIYSSPIKAAGVNLPAILTWIITKFSTRLVIRDVTDSLINLAFHLVTPDTCLPCERLWQISTPVLLWCDSQRQGLVQWSSLKLRRINAIISHVKVHRLTAATELRGGGNAH